jgi:hypothetical protein
MDEFPANFPLLFLCQNARALLQVLDDDVPRCRSASVVATLAAPESQSDAGHLLLALSDLDS